MLRTFCAQTTADFRQPWAVAHGVLAFGPRMKLADRRLAIDALAAWATVDPAGRVGFAAATAAGAPLSPHPGLVVKTWVRAGLPPAQRFRSGSGQPFTLADAERDLEATLPASLAGADVRDLPWALEVLARTHQPGQAVQTPSGRVAVDPLFDEALGKLEADSAALSRGLEQGVPSVPKSEVALSSHPCGGLHLVQALGAWARFPAVRARWGRRWELQRALIFYRAGSEERQLALTAGFDPQARVLILAERLKFEGHWLETVRLLRRESGLRLTPLEEQTVATMRAALETTVGGLEALGILEGVRRGRGAGTGLARDLVGDACHAAAALDD